MSNDDKQIVSPADATPAADLEARRQAFAARQDARKRRLDDAAKRASAKAATLYKRAHGMADVIPLGQPILVGHHSEARDRRYRARIHNTFGAAFELAEHAKAYASRAAAVGMAGISSDDPDAIDKLRVRAAELEAANKDMRRINKLLRAGDVAGLLRGGLTQAQVTQLQTPDFAKRTGFPDYHFTNNNGNRRRILARITLLEDEAARRAMGEPLERAFEGGSIREDHHDNRILVAFDRKPPKEVRNMIAKEGFRWSPSRGAWCRMITAAGRYAADCIYEKMSIQNNAADDSKPEDTPQ